MNVRLLRGLLIVVFVAILGAVVFYVLRPADGGVPANNGRADKLLLETDPRLQSDADALLHLFDNMPSVPVFVSDAPIVKTGTNTERGVAYTNCDDFQVPSIVVKSEFYRTVNVIQRTNILKHELTHAWLCRQRRMNGHDDSFRSKFESVGGFGN